MFVKHVLSFIVFIIIFSFGFSYADPSPLGLTLGKATVSDLKAKYSVEMKGISIHTNGEVYEIDTSNIDIEGLEKAIALFDSRGILVAVLMEFEDYFWDQVYKSLKSKYKLLKAEIPFVGNKYAEFVSGDSIIMLSAPHMDFIMKLIYTKKSLYEIIKEANKKEKERKEKSMEKNL